MLELFGTAMIIGLGWLAAHAVANLCLFVLYVLVGAVGSLFKRPDE